MTNEIETQNSGGPLNYGQLWAGVNVSGPAKPKEACPARLVSCPDWDEEVYDCLNAGGLLMCLASGRCIRGVK